MGLALGKRRKDVFLSTKVFANSIADVEKSRAKSIKLVRTDYFDVLYYHGIGNLVISRVWEDDGVFTWLRARRDGRGSRWSRKAQLDGRGGHNRTLMVRSVVFPR